jgi:uncharacterized protein YndB with AHSA1/START domain
MTSAIGRLQADGERCSVRFERRYVVAPAELWEALTEPGRLRRWLGDAVRFDRAVGGRIELRLGDDESQRVEGAILAFDPPRLLEYEWRWPGEGDSVVRFELAAAGDGTLLVLDHRRLPPSAATGYGAGWHAHLDGLELSFRGEEQSWDDRFAELLPVYRGQAAAVSP